jgi:hypothetical protein
MKGLGFLVWKLSSVFPLAGTIAAWKEIGVTWISIKLREHIYQYNRSVDAGTLEEFLAACKAAGIEVGCWNFVHTTDLVRQAQAISSDIAEFDMKHLMIDAEQNSRVYPGALWKTQSGTDRLAKVYMDGLGVPAGFPVGLCTYRYPELHREFPFEAFLDHPTLTMINPQVYWVHADNPGEQIALSLRQYRRLSNKDFYPVGAAYSEAGWEPSAQEIAEFSDVSKNFDAHSFFRWGQAKEHPDWLEAMKVEGVVYPDPDPDPEPVIPLGDLAPGISALRIRSGPSTGYGVIGYVTPAQPVVEILERHVVGSNTEWWRIGYSQWSAAKYNGTRYLYER